VSTNDDNTAAMITDLATATNLIHAVARDTHAPAARCAEAADHLHQVNQHLHAANEEARRFHAAIGHVGIQYPRG